MISEHSFAGASRDILGEFGKVFGAENLPGRKHDQFKKCCWSEVLHAGMALYKIFWREMPRTPPPVYPPDYWILCAVEEAKCLFSARASGRSIPGCESILNKKIRRVLKCSVWTLTPRDQFIINVWSLYFHFYFGFRGRESRDPIDQFGVSIILGPIFGNLV